MIKISLLGAPSIEYNGMAVRLARRKAVALVAYLAVTGQIHHRDHLATLLWPEQDDQQGRASLRRILVTINETPLSNVLDVNRDVIGLKMDQIQVDVHEFNRLTAEPFLMEHLVEGIELYHDHFMTGFSLRDAIEFDDWQSLQMQILQQRLLIAFSQAVKFYGEREMIDKAILTLQRWLSIEPLNEGAQSHLIRLYALGGQRYAALNQYEQFARLLKEEFGAKPEASMIALYEQIKLNQTLPVVDVVPTIHSNTPPIPPLFIGRETALQEVRTRLEHKRANAPSQVVIQGWPGIGKSTLTAMLVHDEALHILFPDGILWTSLGEYPDLLSKLVAWGRTAGLHEIINCTSIEEASLMLAGFLRDKQVLLIIDDVWESEHAHPFNVAGQYCGIIITTRMNDLANKLAHTPDNIYRLPILTVEQSLQLLQALAPTAISAYPKDSEQLATDLEGLPLALQVAGRLLNAEMNLGWGVADLLIELREGARLLASQAPMDRAQIAEQTTPTIAALLERSINRLSSDLQEKFAVLGVFAPKPATFSLDAIQSVWLVDDAKFYIRALIDRGLLEPATAGNFQMHALLVMYAKSMFEE